MVVDRGEAELDAAGQALYDDVCFAMDNAADELDLMTRTQDVVALLLRRAVDQPLREQTLAEISRFFLGLMNAADLSTEYRIRRLRLFAKATVKLLISKRPQVDRAAAS